jgi:hypothetical protein
MTTDVTAKRAREVLRSNVLADFDRFAEAYKKQASGQNFNNLDNAMWALQCLDQINDGLVMEHFMKTGIGLLTEALARYWKDKEHD